MTEQEIELYAQCRTLPPDDRYPFLQKHGLTAQGLWQHKKQYPKHVNRRKTRATLLAAQNYCCALCEQSASDRMCINKKTGKLVCLACNQYLAAWCSTRAKGITEEKTVAFYTSADGNS